MREISRGRSASLHTLLRFVRAPSRHHHVWHAPRSSLLATHAHARSHMRPTQQCPVLCPIPAGTFVALFISLSPLHDKRCSSTQKAALFAALTPSLISEPLPLRVAYLRSWVIAAL